MKRFNLCLTAALVLALLAAAVGPVIASSLTRDATLTYRDIRITLDGQEVRPTDANGTYVEPFIIDGTTYLPVRGVASALGLEVEWDEQTVTPEEMKATGKALGGPVMIAEGIYASVRRDFWDGLGFLRFLNVNLAILNLLPIPALDGGRLVFLIIEAIRGKPISREKEGMVNTIGFIALMVLMGLIFLNDMSKLIH